MRTVQRAQPWTALQLRAYVLAHYSSMSSYSMTIFIRDWLPRVIIIEVARDLEKTGQGRIYGEGSAAQRSSLAQRPLLCIGIPFLSRERREQLIQ